MQTKPELHHPHRHLRAIASATDRTPKCPARRRVRPLAETYELDPHHSTVQFAVRHQQMSTFRASFTDIEAQLTLDGVTITLEGEARAESGLSGATRHSRTVRGIWTEPCTTPWCPRSRSERMSIISAKPIRQARFTVHRSFRHPQDEIRRSRHPLRSVRPCGTRRTSSASVSPSRCLPLNRLLVRRFS
jgi:YceI-like domain